MTQIIEVRETPIPADAWANYVPQIPELDSGALNSLVDSFLAQGGAIVEVPPGVTAEPLDVKDMMDSDFTNADLYTPEERAAYKAERAAKREHRLRAGDDKRVAAVRDQLPIAKCTKALAKATELSPHVLQRILRDYFADEPMADRFRALDRDQQVSLNEAALIAKIRIALGNGVVGLGNVAKACGSSFTKVAELNTRCKLGIPKGVGGYRKKVTV